MAHECPECGHICHCGGDFDDCCWTGTPEQMACTHCPEGYFFDDDDFETGNAEIEDEH